MTNLDTSETDWNLELIIDNPTDKRLLEEVAKTKLQTDKFNKKWGKDDSYLSNPEMAARALGDYENWQNTCGTGSASYYVSLAISRNLNNTKLKALNNKITDEVLKIINSIQYFEIKFSKIEKRLQKIYLKDKKLLPYRHFLEKLFASAEHILTEPEEKIMIMKSQVSHSNWTRMVSGFLAKEQRKVTKENGKKEILVFSDILGLVDSSNKKVRDSAAKALNEIFENNLEVAENELNSVLQNKKINDELRGFERPDASRHLNDDIETDVVDALTKSVTARFDIAKRYYKLKAKLMNQRKLAYHERNVPIGKLNKEYTYQTGANLVYKVFDNLDNRFSNIFGRFVEEGRIDVYPKKGKRSGAFCTYGLPIHPTYALLNWNNKLNDVLTLAHEIGHGINFELVKQNQNSLNFGVTVATAEVASTFMEDFVLEELMKDADDKLKLSLSMMKLNDDINTIFRQIAFYNFETELHNSFRESGYLSKEQIGSLFTKHMKSYMGDAVSQDEGSQNWWVYVSHFRSFFYVYSYASGLLISKALQQKVKEDHKFVNKVVEFLSAGLSDSPKGIFAKTGIDISDKEFWNTGIDKVEKLLVETEKLAKY